MEILDRHNDQWSSYFYDLPCALSFYLINDTIEGWNTNDESVLGNCPAIQSIQYVPFIEPSDLKLSRIPYDVERFGSSVNMNENLNFIPNVYRIEYIENKIKELASFQIYKPITNKNIGGNFHYANESRLYNYPYRFALLTDHLNKPMEVKYHLINDNDNTANIKVRSTISDRCSYGLFISGYKNDMTGELEALVSGDSHELPCTSSSYNQWFASNKNQISQNAYNIAQNSLITQATGRHIFLSNGLQSVSQNNLNPMSWIGSAGSLYGNVTDYRVANSLASRDIQQGIANRMAQTRDIMNTPNTVLSMGSNVYYGLDKGNRKLTLYRYGLKHEQMEKLGMYFNMFGYKQNRVMNVNIRNRYYFNYIKTVGANLTSYNIPRNHFEQLKAIFDNGVSIWHIDREGVIVGDYSMDNYEV